MKKTNFENELRNEFDYACEKIKYHEAKIIDAKNKQIKAIHEEMITLHESNKTRIIQLLNRLTS